MWSPSFARNCIRVCCFHYNTSYKNRYNQSNTDFCRLLSVRKHIRKPYPLRLILGTLFRYFDLQQGIASAFEMHTVLRSEYPDYGFCCQKKQHIKLMLMFSHFHLKIITIQICFGGETYLRIISGPYISSFKSFR
jgi:hypothetical protein